MGVELPFLLYSSYNVWKEEKWAGASNSLQEIKIIYMHVLNVMKYKQIATEVVFSNRIQPDLLKD